jgi:DNA-binding PadR family transcriptional regulator
MDPHRLNATAASLLGFLHDGPMTGWDLVVTAERRIGDFWSLTQSQVYRELAAMAAAGLVKAGERGPRDRQPYIITKAGRAAFAEWSRQEAGEESIRFPLLLIVMFGRQIPSGRLAAVVAEHRRRHAERLASYEQELADAIATAEADGAGDLDPYPRATLDFGLRYERAVLDWFDALPKEIRGA